MSKDQSLAPAPAAPPAVTLAINLRVNAVIDALSAMKKQLGPLRQADALALETAVAMLKQMRDDDVTYGVKFIK